MKDQDERLQSGGGGDGDGVDQGGNGARPQPHVTIDHEGFRDALLALNPLPPSRAEQSPTPPTSERHIDQNLIRVAEALRAFSGEFLRALEHRDPSWEYLDPATGGPLESLIESERQRWAERGHQLPISALDLRVALEDAVQSAYMVVDGG